MRFAPSTRFAVTSALALASVLSLACSETGHPSDTDGGGGQSGSDGGGQGGSDGAMDTAPEIASCTFEGEKTYTHDSMPAMHVTSPLPPSSYNSSPPSSGPHCGAWGQYAVYKAKPLPACNFLHNLEHGGVALLYNCASGCEDAVADMTGLLTTGPTDPDCGARRLLVTPYADMDVKFAAAAWGYTWKSDCWDASAKASLVAFIAAHLGSKGDAPEKTLCANGSVTP